MQEKIFKAYDIRGIYPTEINEPYAKRIAQAFAHINKAKVVAVGRDVRISSPSMHRAVVEGLKSIGVKVIDIGIVPTDGIYFAVGFYKLDGGIQVTASHNPKEYNGFKMVKKGVEALSSETGLFDVRDLVLSDYKFNETGGGSVAVKNIEEDYFDYLINIVKPKQTRKLKIVANSNFGATGPFAERLLKRLDIGAELVGLNFKPDGNFPKGRPDPLIPENREETSNLVVKEKADFGVAWDADGDRCFTFDEQGVFVEGCHFTALLAEYLLSKHPCQKIIYDPRNIWAVEHSIKIAGGVPVLNRVGHTFIKNRMRSEDALFAGEMSGHFYFRDYFYADNGLLPFLFTIAMLMDNPKKKLSDLYRNIRHNFFVSGEFNYTVKDTKKAIAEIEKKFLGKGSLDKTDGIAFTFSDWRFNIRPSNTEPLLRLNVEAKDAATLDEKFSEMEKLLKSYSTK